MKTKYWFVPVLVAVLLVSSAAMVIANTNKDARLFESPNNLIDRNTKDIIGVYKRVIADSADQDKIELLRSMGCLLKHRLKDSASFECPGDISELDVREAGVFHILDLEADQQIGVDLVWAEGIDGNGINVVILDSGIDSSHIELSDSIRGQKDFVNNDDIAEDDNGHGTHVAGIITANGVYEISSNYATGVSPGAGIYMLKVCNAAGSCYEDDMIAAMEYAVNNIHDARIMSISIGGGNFGNHCDYDPLASKVNWVDDNGFTVVVSAGNDGSGVSSPACASKAIAVGVIDESNVVPYWSNTGSALDIVAPGVDILSTYSCLAAGDCSSYWYAHMSGTSMTAPHVAGVVALLVEANPSITQNDINDALYTTANPAAGCEKCRFVWRGKCYMSYVTSCTSSDQGAGVVDAYGAYQYVMSLTTPGCTLDSECDDGIYCNGAETCNAGTCQSSPPLDCSGLDNQCNQGVCDEASDSCVVQPANEGIVCDDGFYCNVGETCQSGVCSGGSPRDCSGGDSCTTGSCDENTDSCITIPVADGTLCDDNLFCTIDDECISGSCDGITRDCSDGIGCTLDSCSETGDVCVNTPDNSFCDNDLFCDGAETCDSMLGCQPGFLVVCDDSNECTTDGCNEGIDSCDYLAVPDNTPCIGGICCSGSPDTPMCSVDADCNDGDSCTLDICNNPGTCSASCSYSDVTACVDSDGCCPAGCDYTTDSDCSAATSTMHVGDITFDADIWSWGSWGSWCRVTASVPILDDSDISISGANVQGTWSGAYARSVSGSTNTGGEVIFTSGFVRNCGTFVFTVNDVIKSDWFYNVSKNLETSDSITLP